MIHRWEQFYERRKKPGRIGSDLPDLSHRSKKPTPRDFCPKGLADSLHLSLRQGRFYTDVYTDSQDMPSFTHRAIWKERSMPAVENKQVKHGLNILKLLEAVQLPKKVSDSL